MSTAEQPKKEDKYQFEEDELVELTKLIRTWRQKLFRHPESSDHIACLQLEQHLLRRLDEIVTKRYRKEKGLE
jgi:hypothetical protein